MTTTFKDSRNNVSFASRTALCFQCGACTVICPKQVIDMKYSANRGGLFPDINLTGCIHCGKCVQVCPAAVIDLPKEQVSEECFAVHAVDDVIYQRASSGGAVTGILCYLLESGKVNKVITVDTVKENAEAVVCSTTEQVIHAAGSKYQPVSLVEAVRRLNPEDRVAVVGLPCHIKGFTNLMRADAKYSQIILLRIGLFCTIGRSMHQTIGALEKTHINPSKEIGDLMYRHGNFPGDMCFVGDKPKKVMSYQQFLQYGDYFFYPKGCFICNDLMSAEADISVGDAWHLNLGKAACVLPRTSTGKRILQQAVDKGYLTIKRTLSKEEVLITQHGSMQYKIFAFQKRIRFFLKYSHDITFSPELLSGQTTRVYSPTITVLLLQARILNTRVGRKLRNILPDALLFRVRNILLSKFHKLK